MPSLGEMFTELDTALSAFVGEDDREFIEGVRLLIDLGEEVPHEAVQRIVKIYQSLLSSVL